MAHYTNHRSEPYFTFMKNGQKTIEGRVRKGKYAVIKPGDDLTICNNEETDSFEAKVIRIACYKDFRELLTKEVIKTVLPEVISVDEGIQVYRKFYTPGQEAEFGVIAIEVEKIV
jgi:ASC-1-like (ASCH) protein